MNSLKHQDTLQKNPNVLYKRTEKGPNQHRNGSKLTLFCMHLTEHSIQKDFLTQGEVKRYPNSSHPGIFRVVVDGDAVGRKNLQH